MLSAINSWALTASKANVLLTLIILLVSGAPSGFAAVVAERHDLLTMEYQQVGANEEEAVRLACIRAVKATVGRLLFSDYGLQARDLLEPYLQKNWPKYVASTYVLERRADRDGFGVRVRVQTMPEVLMRDLREKRFFYLPEIRPLHALFLAEYVDGQPTSTPLARKALQETLSEEGAKFISEDGLIIDPATDVLASPAAFDKAREAAIRKGAHILIAGRIATSKVSEKEVLYDTIATYESRVELRVARADDGAELARTEVVERASEKDAGVARDEAIRNAMRVAYKNLAGQAGIVWAQTQLEKAKFQVMFTNVRANDLELIARQIETFLGKGTRCLVRSFYGDVGILSVLTSRDYSVLERALAEFQALDLRITDRSGNRITVEVHP
ncbi:hypothetical protein BRCON_0651 [Candidatus Sumerlaea chitinivorans]|uniref:Flagellar assembly protein T N-terminal domain-containing protein n=1 Tax=Sumerlaea chitinivorans TaxID=2250252 RepID=A0A2Z4Y3G7_SUMC1|nr:hypothetical protein BRCON_0651 [Candidatus Sumerlaea chitinivorans]